jgi:alkanesulfonate monooxygenase SsuD/methylene tetrahydromethanopterin reductase-like flavin-dependent oxidoreductase (luciferase family)
MNIERKMHIGAFLMPFGHHIAAWRHPDAPLQADLEHYVQLTKTAERGLLDMLFLADTQAVWAGEAETLHRHSYVAWLEPHTLLSALAAVTKNIGLICTASTTYEEPYLLARKFAALDCVSSGRAGWNLITSSNPNEALNFGMDAPLPKCPMKRLFFLGYFVRNLIFLGGSTSTEELRG